MSELRKCAFPGCENEFTPLGDWHNYCGVCWNKKDVCLSCAKPLTKFEISNNYRFHRGCVKINKK